MSSKVTEEMQDTFRCYRCGAQNFIGESHCVGCGQLLPYTCPKCGTRVNSTFINCPHCHLVLHWPNRQQTETRYSYPSDSQNMSSGLFGCFRCGTQNVIGVKWCRHCNQQFNYNCPNCSAPVDNTFMNCPNCRMVLPWPAENQPQGTFARNKQYGTNSTDFEETRGPKKKGKWPAIVLGGGVLVIIILGLIAASNSARFASSLSVTQSPPTSPTTTNSVSNAQPTIQQVSTSSTSTIPASKTQQLNVPTPSNTTISSSAPDNASTPLPAASTPAPAQIPSSSSPGTNAYNYNEASDSYLKGIQPDWGKPAAPDPNCPLCNHQ